jgi:hypothetical protein
VIQHPLMFFDGANIPADFETSIEKVLDGNPSNVSISAGDHNEASGRYSRHVLNVGGNGRPGQSWARCRYEISNWNSCLFQS